MIVAPASTSECSATSRARPSSSFSPSGYPKRIVLLQHHIERWCRTYAELVDQVHDTVLHEVGHYFGMNHEDIEKTRLRH